MCVFCQIVSGEIPSYKVYEDDQVLAFLDIYPASPGHTLVITKKHYQNLEETPEGELADLMIKVKRIGRLLKDKLGVVGYNISENNDPVAGQEIPHIHFHIIPRRAGDGLGPWPKIDYKEGEAAAILKKLTS
ncbi:MAG: HIT family protein [Patescibacteria group bacterium]